MDRLSRDITNIEQSKQLVKLGVPRKLFKGICICFYEIKDFFIVVFYSAIKDEN